MRLSLSQSRESKPLIFFRFSNIQNVLKNFEASPKEFLYGTDSLIKEKKIDFKFVAKGKRFNLLRKLLIFVEKPMTKIYFLGMPLEVVLENLKKCREAKFIFAVNDAISFAILLSKKIGLIDTPVVTLFQSLSERHLSRFRRNRLAKWFITFLIKESDYVLALSQSSLIELKKNFITTDCKTGVFYFGVDNTFWKPSENKNRDEYILSIGNDSNRDFDTLLNAVGSGYKVKIITSKKIDNKSSNIEVLSALSDSEVREAYQKAKLVVVPSQKVMTEASGLSCTLQSMACGTPVIVSDSLPMREFFGKDEAVAFFEPENAIHLRQVIDDILSCDEKWEHFSESGKVSIQRKFNTIEMEGQVLSLYEYFN